MPDLVVLYVLGVVVYILRYMYRGDVLGVLFSVI